MATYVNIIAETYRRQGQGFVSPLICQRQARIDHFPRKRLHVWNLVTGALMAMGYGFRGGVDAPEIDGPIDPEPIDPNMGWAL